MSPRWRVTVTDPTGKALSTAPQSKAKVRSLYARISQGGRAVALERREGDQWIEVERSGLRLAQA